ncbi:serine carboxypeptidase-like 45, partial [Macadamia integrifolia]|uniref:serine carboxypeptidase-like 45 n=1 Tax=Macadamia integrifolia TaxID=60698 RepID=UPI001C4F40C2
VKSSVCCAEANMLYLEAPVGVGFSYCINTSNYVGVDDEITARDNLIFLQRWFVKFPEYKCRDLFVTGESYAGHYVPQLAQLILQFNKKEKLFNLKGILLGNPLLDFVTDFNSKAEFFWSHGLISDSTYEIFSSACNYSRYKSESFRGSVSPVCSGVMNQVNNEISMYIDKYDVTIDVCLSSILSQSNALTHLQVAEKLDVCVEDETTKYFNRVDVQKALHARLLGVTSWVSCSDNLHYKKLNFEESMIPVVGSLIRSGIRILVFSGDQDSVIPLTGTRTLLHGLANKLGLNTTTTYRAWFEGKQVGGWMQVYGNILSFATIRGASHKAPFSQPERSLVLFNAFLKGKPLPEEFRAIE